MAKKGIWVWLASVQAKWLAISGILIGLGTVGFWALKGAEIWKMPERVSELEKKVDKFGVKQDLMMEFMGVRGATVTQADTKEEEKTAIASKRLDK